MRFVLALLFALVALPLTAGTALAHGGGGLEPGPHLPRVLALDPPVPGLAAVMVEGGARLEVHNGTALPVEVPPAGASRTEEPAVIAPGAHAHWADERIMAAHPHAEGHPAAWAVPLLVGGQEVLVRGETVAPPAPATALWWGLAVLVAIGTVVLGGVAVRHHGAALGLAGVTVLAVAAHVTHVLGAALVPLGRSYPQTVLIAAGIGVGAWALGLAGAGLVVARKDRWGLLCCALAGAVLLLVAAFDTRAFANAVLPFGGDFTLDRALVALTVGIGAGLFLTGFRVLSALTTADAGVNFQR